MCRNSVNIMTLWQNCKVHEIVAYRRDIGRRFRDIMTNKVSMGHFSYDVKPQLGVTPNYFQSSRECRTPTGHICALCVTQSAVKNERRRMSHVASRGPSMSLLQRRYFGFRSLETFRKKKDEELAPKRQTNFVQVILMD